MRRIALELYGSKYINEAKALFMQPTDTLPAAAFYDAKDAPDSTTFVFAVEDTAIDATKAAITAVMTEIGGKRYKVKVKPASVGYLRHGMEICTTNGAILAHSKYRVVAYFKNKDISPIVSHSMDWNTKEKSIVVDDIDFSLIRPTHGLLPQLKRAIQAKNNGCCTTAIINKVCIFERTEQIAAYENCVLTPDGVYHSVKPTIDRPLTAIAADLNGCIVEVATLHAKAIGHATIDDNGEFEYHITFATSEAETPETQPENDKIKYVFVYKQNTQHRDDAFMQKAFENDYTLKETAEKIINNATATKIRWLKGELKDTGALEHGYIYLDTLPEKQPSSEWLVHIAFSKNMKKYFYKKNPEYEGVQLYSIVNNTTQVVDKKLLKAQYAATEQEGIALLKKTYTNHTITFIKFL
jgi:hypothetical protein